MKVNSCPLFPFNFTVWKKKQLVQSAKIPFLCFVQEKINNAVWNNMKLSAWFSIFSWTINLVSLQIRQNQTRRMKGQPDFTSKNEQSMHEVNVHICRKSHHLCLLLGFVILRGRMRWLWGEFRPASWVWG